MANRGEAHGLREAGMLGGGCYLTLENLPLSVSQEGPKDTSSAAVVRKKLVRGDFQASLKSRKICSP